VRALGTGLLAALMALLAACGGGGEAPPEGYRLRVALPDAAGAEVKLYRLRFDQPGRTRRLLMDSARLDGQGTLRLEGPLSSRLLAELRVDGKPYPLTLSPGRAVDLRADLGGTVRWTGAPRVDRLRALDRAWTAEYATLAALGQAFEEAMAAGRTASADSLRQERVDRARTYWDGIAALADSTADPLVAVYAVEHLDWGSRFAEIRRVSNRLLPLAPNDPYVRDLQARVVGWEIQREKDGGTSLLGRPAPELEGRGPDGTPHRLSDLRGRVVLVDFWASWCAPCRRENPNLVAQYERYAERGFTVFSVSLDAEPAPWTEAIAADGLAWPAHLRAADGFADPACRVYGVNAIPAGFLVNAEGIVVAERSEVRGANLASRLAVELGP
jgi:thiol-disulfide isomerase/thioredoxin